MTQFLISIMDITPLSDTLLGGNDLNDRHVFEHVGFFVKLAENQFAGDEFEQPDRFGHCDLLKVVYRPK